MRLWNYHHELTIALIRIPRLQIQIQRSSAELALAFLKTRGSRSILIDRDPRGRTAAKSYQANSYALKCRRINMGAVSRVHQANSPHISLSTLDLLYGKSESLLPFQNLLTPCSLLVLDGKVYSIDAYDHDDKAIACNRCIDARFVPSCCILSSEYKRASNTSDTVNC